MNSRYRVMVTEEPGIGEVALGILALVLFLGVIAAAAGGIILIALLVVGLVSLIVKNPGITITILIITGIVLIVYFIVTRVPMVTLMTGLGGLVGLITYFVAKVDEDNGIGWFGAAFAAVSGAVAVYIGGVIGIKVGELVQYIFENEISLLPFQIAGYVIAAIWVIKSFWALPLLVTAAGRTAIVAGIAVPLVVMLAPVSTWLHADTPRLQFVAASMIAMFSVVMLASTVSILIVTVKSVGKASVKSVFSFVFLGFLFAFLFALFAGVVDGGLIGISGPMLFDLVTAYDNKITRLLANYPTLVSAVMGGAVVGMFFWSQSLNSWRRSSRY